MRLDERQIEVVDDRVAEILKRKTPTERLAIGFGLWEAAGKMISAHLKSLHPDWGDKELQREVARRMSQRHSTNCTFPILSPALLPP